MITIIFSIIAIVVVFAFRVVFWIVRIMWELLKSLLEVFFWAGSFLLFK